MLALRFDKSLALIRALAWLVLCAVALSGAAHAAPPKITRDTASKVLPLPSPPIVYHPTPIPPSIVQIACGDRHSLVLDSDGTVWSWGYNVDGELGDGLVQSYGVGGIATPARVHNLNGVVAIAGGYDHNLALKSDGTVWAWGDNVNGQLGIGVTTGAPNYSLATPVQVVGPGGSGALTGIVAITTGGGHSLARRSDGTVWAWGANSDGQLGIGATTGAPNYGLATPVQVVGPGGSGFLSGVIDLKAGGGHSLALLSNGTVLAWGANSSGQLGNGSFTDSYTPAPVLGLTNIIAIAAGYGHSLALDSSGYVWAWGDNYFGELGDGAFTTTGSGGIAAPERVLASGSYLSGVVAIAAGDSDSIALKSDGTVWGWGYDVYGELGDNIFTYGGSGGSASPVQTVSASSEGDLHNITAIAAGGIHTLALDSSGALSAWGDNTSGQLGIGSFTGSSGSPFGTQFATPVSVNGLSGVVAIAGGYFHSMALNFDGSVLVWGNNYDGELGSGDYNDSAIPQSVAAVSGSGVNVSDNLDGVIAIAAGEFHNLALKSNGTVVAWGYNYYGEVGAGVYSSSVAPYAINTPTAVSGLTGVVAIAAGGYHSLALKSDGTVWAWGYNIWGQLGIGTYSTSAPYGSATPVEVIGLTGVVAIAAGSGTSMALKSDGTVWAWGYNGYGELGIGAVTSSAPYGIAIPVQASGLTNVAAISCGLHCMALKNDGTVWAWGYNYYGEVGNGAFTTTGNESVAAPVQVIGPSGSGSLSDIVFISAGYNHSLAVEDDGTPWAWGYNVYGALGNGGTTNSATPVEVGGGLGDLVAFAGGGYHSLALDFNGFVWAWGDNEYGELGDGAFATTTPYGIDTPALVIHLE